MTDINDLCEEYCDELKHRKIQISEERWKSVLLFRRHVLRQKEVNEVTIHYALRKLSDSFFRHEKQRFITRPNFLICLKEHKIRIHLSVATLIYKSFDIQQKNEFDWRTFMFMMHIIGRNANENVIAHLRFAFKFYVGHFDDIDTPCDSRIKLQKISVVLDMLIKPDRVQSMIHLFDDAWTKMTIAKDLRDNAVSGKSMTWYVTYSRFSLMLEEMELFNKVHSVNGLDEFEKEYYPITLFKYRRCSRLMVHFIKTCTTKTKTETFHRWRESSKQRRRIRLLFHSVSRRVTSFLLSNAFATLWNNTIMHLAATGIQCTYRSFSAKVKSTMKKIIKTSATNIQKIVRGFLERQRFLIVERQRLNAAMTLQQFIRATVGKDLAHNKLLTLIDIELLRSENERELLYYNQTVQCAIKMQRMYRMKSSKEQFKQAVEKKQREIKVAAAMEVVRLEEQTEQRIHKEQIQAHNQNSLSQWKTQQVTEEKTAQDRDRMNRLHLQMKDEQKIEEERQRQRSEMEYVEIMSQKLRDEWEQKEKQSCESYKKSCFICLRAPETNTERRRGRDIKTKIKGRTADVLRRANSRHVEMETDEAREIAEQEVIHILVEEERTIFREEMEKACVDLESRLKEDFAQKENIRKKQQVARAAWSLVSSVRRWQAKKALRLRCIQTFEKVFDDRYQAFYYRNIKTGEVSWNKPRALGQFDLPTKKRMESIYTSEV